MASSNSEPGILRVAPTVDQYMNGLTTCPQCQNNDPSKISDLNIDTDHLVKYCNECDNIFGVDDTSSVYEIQEILKTWQIDLCECGNRDLEKYIVDTEVDDGGNASICFKCCNCDRKFPLNRNQSPESLASSITISCEKCRNDNPDFFEYSLDEEDQIVGYKCFSCDNQVLIEDEGDYGEYIYTYDPISRNFEDLKQEQHVRLNDQKKQAGGLVRERLREKSAAWNLNEADHIAWWTPFGYWHHAFVTAVFPFKNQVEVIHYTSLKNGTKRKIQIVQETLNLEKQKGMLYRIKYNEACLSIEEAFRNALSRLGEQKYNLLKNNCEHFVRWCKTGKSVSGQVHSFAATVGRIGAKLGSRAVIKSAKRGVLEFMKRSVLGSIAGSEFATILTKVTFNAIGVGAVIAVEGISLAYDLYKGYKQMKSGDLQKSEFVKIAVSRSAGAIGGCTGAIAGGAIGQLLIPVPIVGGLIGSTLGVLLGHVAGSFLGRQLCSLGEKIAKKNS